jgi:hypothetical protein
MKCIQFILLLLSPTLLFAQEQYYNILNEDNGLLTNEVYDIHFSKEGFLYIAGDKGIQKYDGAKLENIFPSWNKSLSWIMDDQYGGIIFQSFVGKYWRFAHDSTTLIFDNSDELKRYRRCAISQGRYLAFPGKKSISWYDIKMGTIKAFPINTYKNRSGYYRDMDVIYCNEQRAFGRITYSHFFSLDRGGNYKIICRRKLKMWSIFTISF